MSSHIHTALIGFGKAGQFLHAPFIETSTSFELFTILERTPKGAVQAYPNAQIQQSFESILADTQIELVVIATPNDMHASMIEQALLHGKHVVVDKPFVIHVADAKRLQAVSIQTGKHIFVYQNRRWDGDFLTVQQLLKEGTLGEIHSIESRFDRYRPEPRTSYWKESAELGNGLWYDLGPHLMDQAFYLFGVPTSYTAEIKTQRTDAIGIDYFDVQFQFGPLSYTIHAGMLEEQITPRWLIKGSKGTYTKYGVDPQEAKLNAGEIPRGAYWGMEDVKAFGTIDFNSGESELYQTAPGDYRKFYQGVYETIRNDAPPIISLNDAVELVGWLERLALE
jgi:scyllo-inositol 2-dehydrogenase (NADP+)